MPPAGTCTADVLVAYISNMRPASRLRQLGSVLCNTGTFVVCVRCRIICRASRARSSSSLRMQSAVELDSIEQAQSIILSAAESRDQNPDTVIEAIR